MVTLLSHHKYPFPYIMGTFCLVSHVSRGQCTIPVCVLARYEACCGSLSRVDRLFELTADDGLCSTRSGIAAQSKEVYSWISSLIVNVVSLIYTVSNHSPVSSSPFPIPWLCSAVEVASTEPSHPEPLQDSGPLHLGNIALGRSTLLPPYGYL